MKRIHILHTNDLHSHLEQVPKLFSQIEYIRKLIAQKGEVSLLVDVGDHLDRARLETEGTDGRVNRAILQELGYDVITFGNNELLTFLPEQIATLYKDAPFSIISSNVTRPSSNSSYSWIQRSKIIVKAGVRIGFIGVTIPFDHYYEQMGWKLTDPLLAVKNEVERLRSEVDLLIVLSHVGISFDQMLADQVPEVDLILGGHTHHLLEMPQRIGKTSIAATGMYGQYLGHVTIEWDEERNTIQNVVGICRSVDDEVPNPNIQFLIDQFRVEAEQTLAASVEVLTEPLDVSWEKESPFANLLADSLREWVGTKIALVNSGQLLSGLSSGLVTKQMLHQVCPHPINPVFMKISGDQLFQTLEESLLDTYFKKEIRGFGFRGKILGNISISGLKVLYNPLAPPRKKIEAVYVDQEILKMDKEYDIATIDMFTFGVGYPRLKTGKIVKIFMPEFLRDLLTNQLKKELALNECKKKRWVSTI